MTVSIRSLAIAALAALIAQAATAADILIENRYLHVPVARAGDGQMVHLLDGDEVVRYFSIALPSSASEILYWSSTDVGPYEGKKLTVRVISPEEGAAPIMKPEDFIVISEQSDEIRRPPDAYGEARRPQFHFSPVVGWTNDPNGLAYLDGEYHLFFQHNPYGTQWGNMTWGHAVSRDLLHWEELGDALYADRLGTMYSGSGVVDHKNTSGFQTGAMPPLVVFYTSAGGHSYEKIPYSQSMAYSNDRGRSWTKYDKNPIVDFIAESNRDPKVFWHEPSAQWVMVLYVTRGQFVVMGSKNLREWRKLSDLPFPDGHECPELFELAVDGDPGNSRWVMWEGAGRHLIGRFDGTRFTPESGVLPAEWGSNTYAGQTYNDVPDGRRILLTWMRARSGRDNPEAIYAGMPFNQQMSFPRTLTLRTTSDGIRLFAEPVSEIEKLYANRRRMLDVALTTGTNPLSDIDGELLDLAMVIEPGDAEAVTLGIRGTEFVYTAADNLFTCADKSVTVAPENGHLDLRVLVDRTSIELFAGEGRYVMSFAYRPDTATGGLSLSAAGGAAKLVSLEARELRSIWSGRP